MKKTLFIFIGFSIILSAGLNRSVAGIVTDSITKLQWQDEYIGVIKIDNWQNAINYCEGLSLGGYTDWRLPNINELLSIVDDTKFNPSINSAFTNTSTNYYWSGTTGINNTLYAWIINFNDGNLDYRIKTPNRYIRCVR